MLNLMKEYGSPEGISNAVVAEIEELGVVTLADWNGECWNGCYRSTLSGYPAEDSSGNFSLRPVLYETAEDEYQLVGFEKCF